MPLLSICIPTFNRAGLLDRQLRRFSGLLSAHWDDCELLVSDNASPDETPAVCHQWSQQFSGQHFAVHRQSHNLGSVGNCVACVQQASGTYVWLVGDDDPLGPEVLGYILATLKSSSNLSLLHLNHRCVGADEKTILTPAYYPWVTDQHEPDGKALFERALAHGVGGLYFISSAIFQRSHAIAAAQRWLAGTKNLAWPMYVHAFAAASGSMTISGKPMLDCVYERGSWMKSMDLLYYHDEPAVLLKMIPLGYDGQLMRKLARARTRELTWRETAAALKKMGLSKAAEAMSIWIRSRL